MTAMDRSATLRRIQRCVEQAADYITQPALLGYRAQLKRIRELADKLLDDLAETCYQQGVVDAARETAKLNEPIA